MQRQRCEAIGTCSAYKSHTWLFFREVNSLLKIFEIFQRNFSSSSSQIIQSFLHTLIAPKQCQGKEVATSVTAPLSPSPAIERPIADKKFFPF